MYPLERNMGFLWDLPRRNPVATPWFFGEGTVPGSRELIMRPDPEYFASDGVIPTVNGKPLVDVSSEAYNFNRREHTFRV